MRIMQIICDGCGEDFSTISRRSRYRLTLDVDYLLPDNAEHIRALAAEKPPLDRAHHFCNLRCLDRWRREDPAL